MKRSSKVLKVYGELKRALGNRFTASQLMAVANRIVRASNKKDAVRQIAEHLFENGIPCLDTAFADGGWQVLTREFRGNALAYDDDYDSSWQFRHFRNLCEERVQ